MRIEKAGPPEAYRDFGDWLTRSWHIVLVLSIVVGYAIYLVTTEER